MIHSSACPDSGAQSDLKSLENAPSKNKNVQRIDRAIDYYRMDWTGLLAWSTKYHDGTHSTEIQPLSEERKEFLKKALEEAAGGALEDQNERLRRALRRMLSDSSEDRDAGLEEVDLCSDYPDCAENFHKLGGLEAFEHYLEVSSNKARALSVLSLYLSNNPTIQLEAWNRGWLKRLMRFINPESINGDSTYRAVSTIGQLVRGVEQIEKGFVELGGMQFLVHCRTTGDSRIQQKASALIEHLHLECRPESRLLTLK